MYFLWLIYVQLCCAVGGLLFISLYLFTKKGRESFESYFVGKYD